MSFLLHASFSIKTHFEDPVSSEIDSYIWREKITTMLYALSF